MRRREEVKTPVGTVVQVSIIFIIVSIIFTISIILVISIIFMMMMMLREATPVHFSCFFIKFINGL